MRYLIDTNVFIWYVIDDNRLSKNFINILSDLNSDLWISIASLWEITIKNAKGDLIQDYELPEFFEINILLRLNQ